MKHIYVVIAQFAFDFAGENCIVCFKDKAQAEKYAAGMEERNVKNPIYSSITVKEIPLF